MNYGTKVTLVVSVLQAEEADFTADLHGNWTLENAKSRLHQFMQTNRIKAEYKYAVVGPDHNRFDENGWHVRLYVGWGTVVSH